MNIFAVSDNPRECAEALDDKRVGKMLMETCQMLSVAAKSCWSEDDKQFIALYEDSQSFTKGMAYLNHPCSIWVRSTDANYDWTIQLAWRLRAECHQRYGKFHASGDRIPFLEKQRDCLPPGELLPFANCARNAGLGLDFTTYPVHEAYRRYLVTRWEGDKLPVTFKNRGEPEWRQEIQSCM